MAHIMKIDEWANSSNSSRVYDCSEIFKEGENVEVSQREFDIIKKYSPEYKCNDDKANGYFAIALDFLDYDKAMELVDELNNIDSSKPSEWFVGDEDEEYVFVD